MRTTEARAWLNRYAEPTPVDLETWLDRVEAAGKRDDADSGLTASDGAGTPERAGDETCATTALTVCASSALASAMSTPGRHRPVAFDLLAGGAFVGYACESALRRDSEPVPKLWDIVRWMAATRAEEEE
ncbi:MAG: hypothetical protein J4G12_02720 [Gemmatimonadetes bacterium]|nr:hypothetical protein [Gemmatimonadota bacterium]